MRRAITAAGGLILLATALVVAPATPAVAAPTVTVDVFEDTFDGSCDDGDCSLRDAVAAVDPGGTVRVPPGFYSLTLIGGGPNAGDVDLVRPMRIVGTGETGTFLDATDLGDRIFDITANVTLHHLALLSGTSAGAGGLVRVPSGSLAINRSTLVFGSAQNGGAIAVGANGALTIARSLVSANQASGRGGGLYARGPATISRSTFAQDVAAEGGAVFVSAQTTASLADSTLSGNRADSGGAIHARGAVEVSSSTVAANRADAGGGVWTATGLLVTVENSVFDGNRAAAGRLCARPLSSGGHNAADVFGCGLNGPGDVAGVDPMLGGLRQNGGPTPTHALAEGSPAIGRGVACHWLDQRGAPRNDCDSGAYELVRCLGRPVTMVGTPGDDELSGGLGRDVFLGLGGDDEFQGSLNEDRACGGPGDDHLIGGPERDRLAGGAGHDELHGEGGDDALDGGRGSDECLGGPGTDAFRRCEAIS